MNEKEIKKPFYHKLPTSKKRFWVGAGACAIFMVAFGVHYYVYERSHDSTDDAYVEAHIIQISAKIPSHVTAVAVEDNQEVAEGALLVEEDVRDYETKLAIATAESEAAIAERSQAADDVERYVKLQASDELSRQQLDRSRLRLEQAQAQVARAKAALDQARLYLSYTKIMSPSKGRVTKKSVEVGAYVQTGQALLAIVTPERWVVANFKETQLTHMRPGQEARIKVDAYPGKVYRGRVESIQRGTGARFSLLPAENATGNFVKVVQRVPVKIVFDEEPEPGHPLIPGMSVDVSVVTS
ncbi:MAG: HlyD family secretion protein [Candidatus Omnitrophota bacterium]